MQSPATVGLLLCDRLDPDVEAQVGGNYDDVLFPALLAPLGAEVTVFDARVGELPTSADQCDAWITSGSRHTATDDDPWIKDLGDCLVQLANDERPLVAVCFGHQLLARAAGGRVERAAMWGVGARRFAWTDGRAADGSKGFTALMSHQDQVTQLPPGARLLAEAEYCPVGAYTWGTNTLSLQGHPEFVPELCRALISRRRPIIGDQVSDAGLASLADVAGLDATRDWVVSTLGHGI